MIGLLGHWWVLVLVLALVLILYGPGKLPSVGGAIGKAIRDLRKSASADDAGADAATGREPKQS